MNHKFNVGETVRLAAIKGREVYVKVIEKIEGRPYYKVDWGGSGFNSVLNTVGIAESAMQKVK